MRVAKVEARGYNDPMSTDWNVRVTMSDGSVLNGVRSVSRKAGSSDEFAQFTITLLDAADIEWVGFGPVSVLAQRA